MSFFGKIFGGYDQLWKAIIRPPRDEYKEEELGPKEFHMAGVKVRRSDIDIRNPRGFLLKCSFFEPVHRNTEQLPCVIYLHGNSSSRLECLPCIETLLPSFISIFSFDFSGCGQSEGEFISLGWYEREDVKAAIDYLRGTGRVSTIGIWGRSMGAATALMYVQDDPSIAGIVLDSPFQSLRILAEELTTTHAPKLPKLMVNSALGIIKKTVLQKAKFDITKLNPIDFAKIGFVPALFVHGNDDQFIKKHHSQNLYDVYQGDKNIQFVEGEHNSMRPSYTMDSIGIFFYNTLQCSTLIPKIKKDKSELSNTYRMNFHQSPTIPPVNIENHRIGNDDDLENLFGNFEDPDLQEAIRISMEESMKQLDKELKEDQNHTKEDENVIVDLLDDNGISKEINIEKINNYPLVSRFEEIKMSPKNDDDLIDFGDDDFEIVEKNEKTNEIRKEEVKIESLI